MNNLTNAYTLSQDLKESSNKLQSHKNDLNGIKTSQKVFTIGTFFIYFSFTSVIFAGVTVWNLQDYIFGNYTNVIGMVWALAVVFLVPLALSLAKHFNYKAIAKGSVERGNRSALAVRAIIVLALLSGLYYEAISASSNLQSKAFHAVDYKGNLQGILNAKVDTSVDAHLSDKLSAAEVRLATCQKKEAEMKAKGRKYDCVESIANLATAKSQVQGNMESSVKANTDAISVKKEVLSDAVAEQALPAAKYVAEMAGRSNDYGTMVIVIIAALFFELIHISTIFNEARALRGIDNENAALKTLNAQYFNETGKAFDIGDFKDNRQIDLSDKPLNIDQPLTAKASGSYWDTDPERPVQRPLYKYQQAGLSHPAPAPSSFIGFRDTSNMDKTISRKPVPDPATVRESGGFKQSPEQLAKVRELARDSHPTPAIPPTTKRDSETTTKRDGGIAGQRDSGDMLYQRWKRAVSAGELSTACGRFYKFARDNGNFTGIANRVLDVMWNEFGERGVKDGWLLHNPDFIQGSTKPKYVLNPAYKQAA